MEDWLYARDFEREVLRRVGDDEERRMIGRTWSLWRDAWNRRRKGRWEQSLREREGAMVRWNQERVQRGAFEVIHVPSNFPR